MPRLYVETFGCQMNEADSRFVRERASAAGYTLADRPEEADVVVLNTCTVRDHAERRAYGRITHLKALKDADPGVRVVVTGCLAEQDRDRMQAIAPHVDAVFGTSELARLADQLAAWSSEFEERDPGAEARALLAPLGGGESDAGPFARLRGYATVQRGCSYYCTFCIVPHVRGRFDHRPMHEILSDVRAAVAAGAREVLLVGQTVNAWRDPASGAGFGELCAATAAVAGVERVAFISPHPKDFDEAMIRRFAELPALAPRVHLPLQSGSDAVLRRMNRKYTRTQFEEKVALFRRYLPDWAITTDIIVGFPGETDGDFEQTLELVRAGTFANAYMFMYSMRRGTPAARWPQVPDEIKKERFSRLVEAQNAVTLAYHRSKIGSVERALVSGPSKRDPGKLAAKTGDNVTVIAPMPPDYDEERYRAEPWVDVAVEAAHPWGCTGTVIGRAAHRDEPAQPVRPPIIDLLAT